MEGTGPSSVTWTPRICSFRRRLFPAQFLPTEIHFSLDRLSAVLPALTNPILALWSSLRPPDIIEIFLENPSINVAVETKMCRRRGFLCSDMSA